MQVKPLFSLHGAAAVPESAAIGRVTALLTVTDRDSGRNGLVTCYLDNVYFSLQKLELNEYKVRHTCINMCMFFLLVRAHLFEFLVAQKIFFLL